MDFIFTEIYSFRFVKKTAIAAFFILLGLGINTIKAQVNDKGHPMVMHELKQTGRSAYNDVHINKLKWKSITGSEIWSSPIVGPDNTIYVSSTDGNIFAYSPDGTEKWHYRAGYELYSNPVIGAY